MLAGQRRVGQPLLPGEAIPEVDESLGDPVVGDGGELVGEALGNPLLEVEELISAEDIERNGGHAPFLDFAGQDEAGNHKILKGSDFYVSSFGEIEVDEVASEGVGLPQEVLLAALGQ